MLRLILLLIFVSCSSNKSEKLGGSLTVIDSTNDIENFLDEKDKQVEIVVKEEPVYINTFEEKNLEKFSDTKNILTKKISEYKVKNSNETLMLIAFNIYGDFLYWKSIAELNEDSLNSDYQLRKGMRILYYEPKRSFSYNPDGNPFLIKRGHSLSKISDIVYENWERWPEIRNNNSRLIKNPNKIYAGFTLFYLPDEYEERNSISEKTKENLEIIVEDKPSREPKKIIRKPKPKKLNKKMSLLDKMKSRFLASEKKEEVSAKKSKKPQKSNKNSFFLNKLKKAIQNNPKNQ